MQASDVMNVGVLAVQANATIKDAAHIMIRHQISGLPVLDEKGALAGIVTEGDLLRRAEIGTERHRPRWIEIWVEAGELAEEYAREHGRRVADVMTRRVITAAPETPVSEVVDLMSKNGVKRIPVTVDGKVVGMVSRTNLLAALARRLDEVPRSVVDDLAIRKGILEELQHQDWAPVGTIDIVVHDGVVELNGTVTDKRVRNAVRAAAENARGAKRVEDNLSVVQLPAGYL